jgi:quinol monooxygenase YgiN
MNLVVIATIMARPDAVTDLRQALGTLVQATRQEPGCLRYDLLQNRENPVHFVMNETWEDEAALTAHQQTVHLRDYAGYAAPLLAEPMSVLVFRTLC